MSKRYHRVDAVRRTFPVECTPRRCVRVAIFVSNVIIPGRRPENQPDGLSPTKARARRRQTKRERESKVGEREDEAKVNEVRERK